MKRRIINYAIASLFFAAYCAAAMYFFSYVCPSMVFVGLPCPACGFTRAGLLLLAGRFEESLRMNPMLVPALAFAAGAFLCKIFRPGKIKYFYLPAAALIVIFVSVFIYRMGISFPESEPLVVNGDSVLHKILYILKGDAQ